jgi:hypothetical protein
VLVALLRQLRPVARLVLPQLLDHPHQLLVLLALQRQLLRRSGQQALPGGGALDALRPGLRQLQRLRLGPAGQQLEQQPLELLPQGLQRIRLCGLLLLQGRGCGRGR